MSLRLQIATAKVLHERESAFFGHFCTGMSEVLRLQIATAKIL